MLETQQSAGGTRTGWTAVAVTLAAAIGLGAAFVALVLGTGLEAQERVGHASGHLALGLPAALVAVLAWRWWPRRLPSRISTVGAAVLRVVLVLFCVGTTAEVIAAFTTADPDGDGLLHDIGLLISVASMMAVLAGLGLLLLGALLTAAAAFRRILSSRQRSSEPSPSGSMV